MTLKCFFGHKWYVTEFSKFKGRNNKFINAPFERECGKCQEKQ